MTALAALKADQARIWGSAAWQQIAERQLFPVHEELIARLLEPTTFCVERRRTQVLPARNACKRLPFRGAVRVG